MIQALGHRGRAYLLRRPKRPRRGVRLTFVCRTRPFCPRYEVQQMAMWTRCLSDAKTGTWTQSTSPAQPVPTWAGPARSMATLMSACGGGNLLRSCGAGAEPSRHTPPIQPQAGRHEGYDVAGVYADG